MKYAWLISILLGIGVASVSLAAQETAPPPAQVARPLRVRVSQGVLQSLLVKKVQPEYPAEARHKHIQGGVLMSILIDRGGDVKELNLLSGDPLLAPAAIEAVKQWKYKPYLLNGQPVEVDSQVRVNFELSLR